MIGLGSEKNFKAIVKNKGNMVVSDSYNLLVWDIFAPLHYKPVFSSQLAFSNILDLDNGLAFAPRTFPSTYKKDILQIVQIVCFLNTEKGQTCSGNPSGLIWIMKTNLKWKNTNKSNWIFCVIAPCHEGNGSFEESENKVLNQRNAFSNSILAIPVVHRLHRFSASLHYW